MFAKSRILPLLAFAIISSSGTVLAQKGRLKAPTSSGAGAAELQQIYRESSGSDYSIGSLNRFVLNNVRGNVNYSGGATGAAAPHIGTGLSSGSGAGKPFAGYTPEPTVKPYLNLFREDLDGNSDLNYNTLVRPQLQQQQFNQQLQRQTLELNRRLQSMAAQSDFNPEGSKSQYPTGHQTTFMYYGHYYPSAGRPRR